MKIVHFCIALLGLLVSIELVQCEINRQVEENRLLELLFATGQYNKGIRPKMAISNFAETDDVMNQPNEQLWTNENGPPEVNYTRVTKNGPTLIRVNIYLRSINFVDDTKQQFSVQLTFRQQWNDDRLKFDDMYGQIPFLTLTDNYVESIWKPDTFFTNEMMASFHILTKPNVLLRIYPNGNVLYSMRVSVTLSCPMNLAKYPVDEHFCNIQLASYGYTNQDIAYQWKERNPIQISAKLNVPLFKLSYFKTEYCTSRTSTGSYSCLKARFLLARRLNYYLIRVYIPCTMFVLISWIAFWMDVTKNTTARALVSLCTLLTLTGIVTFINASLPPVSYTKAIDVWTGVSLTFVFAALFQFAVVNYLVNRESEENKIIVIKSINVDRVSRIVFPIVFTIFMNAYAIWIYI